MKLPEVRDIAVNNGKMEGCSSVHHALIYYDVFFYIVIITVWAFANRDDYPFVLIVRQGRLE